MAATTTPSKSAQSQAGRGLSPDAEEDVRTHLAILKARTPPPTRQELVLCAAKLLFLDHQVHPSAQAVYRLVRRGSMTDINKDLQAFWMEMRQGAKLQHTGTDLPEDVQHAASRLLREMWLQASEQAQKQAREGEGGLHRRIAELEAQCAELGSELASARESATASMLTLAEEQAMRKAAEQQAAEETRRYLDEIESRRSLEQRFTEELHTSIRRDDGGNHYALRQIEEARTQMRDKAAELAHAKNEHSIAETRYTIQISQLRDQLGEARLALGSAEARLGAVTEERDRLRAQIEAVLGRAKEEGTSDNPGLANVEALRRDAVLYTGIFELMDLADARLDASGAPEDFTVYLTTVVGDGGGEGASPDRIELTPRFGSLKALNTFIDNNIEQYRDQIDSAVASGSPFPERWFWAESTA